MLSKSGKTNNGAVDIPTNASTNNAKNSVVSRAISAVPQAGRRFTLSLLLAAFASAATVALMGVSAWLLSRAAEHPPVMYLTVATVGVRFFGISRGVFRYVERLVGHDLALRMQTALRLETYAKLARTTLLGTRRGDLLTRVVADVEAIQDIVVRVWIPLASATLVIISTSATLGAFSPGSAAVLLISALLAGVVVPWLAQRASQRADAAAVPTRGELAGVVHEISRTSTDLVAYRADERYLDQLLLVDEKLKQLEFRAVWVRGIATAAQIIAAGLAVIGALWIGGYQVAAGNLSPVMLAVLTLTPLALHEVLSSLTQAAQTYTRARVALDRVQQVVDAKPVGLGDLVVQEIVDAPGLALTDVTIGWPGHNPLATGLTLSVTAGERVAVIGRSGVGKTTLAATILGLIPPIAGSVKVAGRIGYLAQDAHIFASTIRENVKIGNKDATDDEVAEALNRAGLHLDLDRLVGESGTQLSGGEARRLALSRLLVGNFQVFVLDEPTEHLDADTAAALLADIEASTANTPTVIITHDPDVMARCNRVLEL